MKYTNLARRFVERTPIERRERPLRVLTGPQLGGHLKGEILIILVLTCLTQELTLKLCLDKLTLRPTVRRKSRAHRRVPSWLPRCGAERSGLIGTQRGPQCPDAGWSLCPALHALSSFSERRYKDHAAQHSLPSNYSDHPHLAVLCRRNTNAGAEPMQSGLDEPSCRPRRQIKRSDKRRLSCGLHGVARLSTSGSLFGDT